MAGEQKLVRTNSSLNPSFPGNAATEPKERPKVESVVKGRVSKRKKTWLQRMRSSLTSEENQSVGDYILYDILVPAIKSTVVDVIAGGIEMVFYGERRSRPNNIRRDGSRSYIPYASYYQGDDNRKPPASVSPKYRYTFDDILFTNRADAENVLSEMNGVLEEYSLVSVANFYDFCKMPHEYTDDDYGWTDLREAFTERIRDGYIVRLPRVKYLK